MGVENQNILKSVGWYNKLVMNFFIYGLFDPITNELRYIGQTIQKVEYRLRKHISESGKGTGYYKNCWIKSLTNKGLKPEIFVLEACNSLNELNDAEEWYIQYYKSLGCKLTNMAYGGNSHNKGVKHSVKNRIKFSEAKGGEPVIDQFGKVYFTPVFAAEAIKADVSNLRAVLYKKQAHIKGFCFNYLSEGKPNFDFEEYKRVKNVKWSRSHGGKPFKDQFGNIYQSTMEAERALNFDHSGIQKVLAGKRRQCNGYIFTYFTNTNLNLDLGV